MTTTWDRMTDFRDNLARYRVFTDAEHELLSAAFEKRERKDVENAIRFRNSLQAFMRDAERAQSATPVSKVMAVDSPEIIAHSNYDEITDLPFAFEGLLTNASKRRQPDASKIPVVERLRNLDQLINQQLFHKDGEKVLLLDPYFDEVQILKQGHLAVHKRARDRFASSSPELTMKQLELIRDYLANSSDANFSSRWRQFREEFIPLWGDELLQRILKSRNSVERLDAFLQGERYAFLRDESFGSRSFAQLLPPHIREQFDFARFELYCDRPHCVARADEIYDTVLKLFEKVRGRRGSEFVAMHANALDSQAFVTLDALNCFLIDEGINARVELVTRSRSMHDVLGALPDGRLRVTLRHPLFIPDIYAFDRETLGAISDILQRLDGAIAQLIGIKDDSRSAELHEACFDVFELLESTLTAQHTLENKSKIDFSDIGAKSDFARRYELITTVFRALSESIKERNDPFSKELIEDSINQNLRLVRSSEGHVFPKGAKFTFRVLAVKNPLVAGGGAALMPREFLSVRLINGSFTRLFHLHSSRVQELFEGSNPTAHDKDPKLAREYELSAVQIIDKAEKAYQQCLDEPDFRQPSSTADASKQDRDTLLFSIDAILLVGMAFASMRRYDIASILASTVLHPMIMEMRSQERTFLPSAVRRRLAYRELFLFRHYCERTMARDDFFSRERRLTDSKGSISKNLARAQRDLDFAALMSEDVERCLNHGDAAFESIGPSSAGQEVLRDQRLKLAHCGSIIDQLAIILMEQSKAPPLAALKVQGDLLSSRSRLDTWVLAGIVRETLADAQTALRARIQLSALRDTDQSAIRYHAYQEARSLQNVLLIFAIFLTFEISPPLHRLWTVECKLEPEQLLVFREWEDWWERFVSLNNMFDFELRAFPFLSAVLSSVIAIRRVAMEGSPRQHGKITDREAVVIKLLEDCKGTLAIMSKSQPKGLLSQLENQLWKRLTEIQIDIGSAG